MLTVLGSAEVYSTRDMDIKASLAQRSAGHVLWQLFLQMQLGSLDLLWGRGHLQRAVCKQWSVQSEADRSDVSLLDLLAQG